MITVVAAIIEHEAKLLVCQRRRGGAFELKWEFPGGKVRPGESLEAALERELYEELGAPVRIGRQLHRVQHRYSEMPEPVDIVFFAAEAAPEKLRNCVFERIDWCEPEKLRELDFLEADRDLVELLAAGKAGL